MSRVKQATAGMVNVAHKMELRSSIFNGDSFRISRDAASVPADDTIEQALMQMPSIVRVYPNRMHYRQAPVDFTEIAPSDEKRYAGVEDETLLPRQGGTGSSPVTTYGPEGSSLINPHALTGVDKLHDAGILGQDMKIAVIDAGIDSFHPVFGDGYGPGFKGLGGYDLVGDQPNNDVDPPAPDDSPVTVCANHGTATSSLAAGLPCK